jgi:hypothetical protein
MTYSSNEEFFQAITNLMDRMRQSGYTEAEQEIRQGYGCLNGLTDGWGMLLDSIEKVIASHGRHLPAGQLSELKAMFDVVKKVVYR